MPPTNEELLAELNKRLQAQEERQNALLEELRGLRERREKEKPISPRERISRGFEAIRQEREGKKGSEDNE